MDPQPPFLADGLIDDYEYWPGELPETPRKDKKALYVPDLWSFQVELVSRPAQQVPD
jgi:hypothetical protein